MGNPRNPGYGRVRLQYRRKGNPEWGRARLFTPRPVVLTEYELVVKKLGLDELQDRLAILDSVPLKAWVYRHRNNRYVPEWLLKAWGIDVNDTSWGYAEG